MSVAFWKIISTPEEFFRGLEANPSWGYYFFSITVLEISFTSLQVLLSFPYMQSLQLKEIFINGAGLIMLICVRNTFIWFLVSLALYCLLMAISRIKTFSLAKCTAIVVASNIIACASLIFSIVIGYARIILSIANVFEPTKIFSLSAIFFFPMSGVLRYVLDRVNIFNVWYVILLAKGVHVISPMKVIKSYCIATLVFMFELLLRWVLLDLFVSMPSLILK